MKDKPIKGLTDFDIHGLRGGEADDFYRIWEEAFGDGRADVDEFLACFGDNASKFVLKDEGSVRAILTQYPIGDLFIPGSPKSKFWTPIYGFDVETLGRPLDENGSFKSHHIPVDVSYAIATETAGRGKGYGKAITDFARKWATDMGHLSALCPASNSLEKFYSAVGYESFFYAEKSFAPALLPVSMRGEQPFSFATRLTPDRYNEIREIILKYRPHIVLNENALAAVSSYCDEGLGFFMLEKPFAIFVAESLKDGELYLSEVLTYDVEPRAVAAVIAAVFGADSCRCKSPVTGFPPFDDEHEGMIACPDHVADDDFSNMSFKNLIRLYEYGSSNSFDYDNLREFEQLPYFGFPFP